MDLYGSNCSRLEVQIYSLSSRESPGPKDESLALPTAKPPVGNATIRAAQTATTSVHGPRGLSMERIQTIAPSARPQLSFKQERNASKKPLDVNLRTPSRSSALKVTP